MSPNREETLFALALEQPVAERAAFLKGACLGDDSLRVRVEELLTAHDATLNPLATQAETTRPTLKLDPADLPDEAVGQTLGRYKLLERIGEGGCGVVYVAEQTEPVRRRVALKVIKLGMDTKQVVARFEAERQALAMMDHPNIAKVLDAGTTLGPPASLPASGSGKTDPPAGMPALPGGRPYFVMELVRGIRITDYCDQANLSTKERLDLFIKVCHAIQHAHQKGIIHRDIKPSNILVTLHDGVPVPKVIDFGIAKATEGRLTDNTVYTQLHQFIGTPAYMSPEQAEMSGLDIDTRSDIYSLGVLLYELLAGSTPFDAKELMASGIDAMRKTIREKEPPRPSTRLATLGADQLTTTAKRRSVDAPRLIHQLKGDLDWIVMKCLEKDRQRRYDTANGLAADLNRHLDNEPVTARPPSTAYRLQKALRRNKLVFAAAGAVAVALVLGAVVSTWQAVKATQAGAQAQAKQLEAEAERSRAQQERQRADGQARKAIESQEYSRRLLYAADMNLAQQSVSQGNLGRARRLLDRHRPGPGEEDLRGWEWRYLWQQCRSDAIAVLTRRPGRAGTSVSFSPDGAQLAVGYRDGRVELWDVARRSLLKELQTNGAAALVAFSPRSNVLATTAGGRTLRLHDFSDGRDPVLWAVTNGIRELSFTPDGQRLVAFRPGVEMSEAVTFDMVQGRAVRTNDTRGGNNFRGNARLSADGRRLFLSDRDSAIRRSSVRCLEFATGQRIWEADVATNSSVNATAMALSPDDRFLVATAGSQSTPIHVWEAGTGKWVARLDGHTGEVRAMVFSPDGRWLASAASDQSIRLWRSSGEPTGWMEVRVLRGHGDQVQTVAFSPDGRTLASGGRDGEILLWDTGADRPSTYGYRLLKPEVRSLSEVTPGIALANGNKSFAPGAVPAANRRFLLRLEDLLESPVPAGFDLDSVNTGFLPNLFVTYDQTNVLRVVEFRDGWSELLRESVGPELEAYTLNASRARGSPTPAPKVRQIAWTGISGTIHLAELDSSKRRWQWISELRSAAPLEFSPDGSLLALGGSRVRLEDGLGLLSGPRQGLEVREVATGKLILKSELLVSDHNVRFADAGRRLVAVSVEGKTAQVVFWDLTRPAQPPKAFTESGGFELDVSPDGRWVSLHPANGSGEVILYDAAAMERSSVLQGMAQEVFSTRFSPDSRQLVSSAGGQAAAQLWQVDTGQELLTLPGAAGTPLFNILFAEDGNTLLAGTPARNSWQMWRAPSWEVIHAAEAKDPPAPGSGGQGKVEGQQP